MSHTKVEFIAGEEDMLAISAVVARRSGLTAEQVKDAMAKGAVWLKTQDQNKHHRIRKPGYTLHKGDEVVFNYKASFLARHPPQPKLIEDRQRYSIWYKPRDLMPRGNEYGDHFSLVRLVDRHFKPFRHAFFVQRLDSEAHGLVIVAHDTQAASRFLHLFKQNEIAIDYKVLVQGRPEGGTAQGVIDEELDGIKAETNWQVISYLKDLDQTELLVQIKPGCRHQIRRHFQAIGTPVIGDRLYKGEKKGNLPLQLVAARMKFECPIEHQPVEVNLPDKLD